MTPQQWLERATCFDLGECQIHHRPVKIEIREQIEGPHLWVVKMHEWVLGKDAEWYWEPLPSSRTDQFIANTRFKSPDDAYEFWWTNVTRFKPLTVDV